MKKGFTLVEFAAVLIVLGVVLAVIIPKFIDTMAGKMGHLKWKVTYKDKTELFKFCDEVYFGECIHCERNDESEIRICGDYTVEKLSLNNRKTR